jgi:hypothetical protein
MQLFWGMINTLQLIEHMSMYSVLLPANVQLVFSLIVGIVNFKVIPTDTLVEYLTGFKEKVNSKMSPEATGAGYESAFIMKNLGLIVLGTLVISITSFGIGLLYMASRRFNK